MRQLRRVVGKSAISKTLRLLQERQPEFYIVNSSHDELTDFLKGRTQKNVEEEEILSPPLVIKKQFSTGGEGVRLVWTPDECHDIAAECQKEDHMENTQELLVQVCCDDGELIRVQGVFDRGNLMKWHAWFSTTLLPKTPNRDHRMCFGMRSPYKFYTSEFRYRNALLSIGSKLLWHGFLSVDLVETELDTDNIRLEVVDVSPRAPDLMHSWMCGNDLIEPLLKAASSNEVNIPPGRVMFAPIELDGALTAFKRDCYLCNTNHSGGISEFTGPLSGDGEDGKEAERKEGDDEEFFERRVDTPPDSEAAVRRRSSPVARQRSLSGGEDRGLEKTYIYEDFPRGGREGSGADGPAQATPTGKGKDKEEGKPIPQDSIFSAKPKRPTPSFGWPRFWDQLFEVLSTAGSGPPMHSLDSSRASTSDTLRGIQRRLGETRTSRRGILDRLDPKKLDAEKLLELASDSDLAASWRSLFRKGGLSNKEGVRLFVEWMILGEHGKINGFQLSRTLRVLVDILPIPPASSPDGPVESEKETPTRRRVPPLELLCSLIIQLMALGASDVENLIASWSTLEDQEQDQEPGQKPDGRPDQKQAQDVGWKALLIPLGSVLDLPALKEMNCSEEELQIMQRIERGEKLSSSEMEMMVAALKAAREWVARQETTSNSPETEMDLVAWIDSMSSRDLEEHFALRVRDCGFTVEEVYGLVKESIGALRESLNGNARFARVSKCIRRTVRWADLSIQKRDDGRVVRPRERKATNHRGQHSADSIQWLFARMDDVFDPMIDALNDSDRAKVERALNDKEIEKLGYCSVGRLIIALRAAELEKIGNRLISSVDWATVAIPFEYKRPDLDREIVSHHMDVSAKKVEELTNTAFGNLLARLNIGNLEDLNDSAFGSLLARLSDETIDAIKARPSRKPPREPSGEPSRGPAFRLDAPWSVADLQEMSRGDVQRLASALLRTPASKVKM
ncbi:hypothetical protein B0T16DRAFT_41268 [Cercophora newfieldiana]|uniref:ATP-grasp domain-containing protein n=1 Tax=Cercophora newfieldiana TaxID=92897 RepID=A0AA40D111_9PEZI|nr:hypothetical protein B0T16DRAFT_41268 [Cercophora newfieldiana]